MGVVLFTFWGGPVYLLGWSCLLVGVVLFDMMMTTVMMMVTLLMMIVMLTVVMLMVLVGMMAMVLKTMVAR